MTVTQLRSFLGAVNVYRKFVKNFARVAAPLYKLQKDLLPQCGRGSRHPITLDQESVTAFRAIVDTMCSLLVLALPVADRSFSIDTVRHLNKSERYCSKRMRKGSANPSDSGPNNSIQPNEIIPLQKKSV